MQAAVLVVIPGVDVPVAQPSRHARAGSSFGPLALGLHAAPVVTDRARAEAEPELAALSVMAHGDVDRAVSIARAAVAGTGHVSDRNLPVYS